MAKKKSSKKEAVRRPVDGLRWFVTPGKGKELQQQVLRGGKLLWEGIPIFLNVPAEGYCPQCGTQEAAMHVCPQSTPVKGKRYRCACCISCMAKCTKAEHGAEEEKA